MAALWKSVALATALMLIPCAAPAGDWPQWRGPTGMGFTDEKNLPTTWGGKTAENVLWKIDLPKSHNPYSSPIVVGDHVYLTWSLAQPLEHHVTCYQKSDGRQLWDAVVPPGKLKYTDGRATYSAPTPAADAQRVYAVFGSAVVAGLAAADGKVLWRHELERISFDVCMGSSPVLYPGTGTARAVAGQDTIIYLADQNDRKSSLIAFDRKSGAVKWEALRPDAQFAHSTPIVITVKGAPQLVIAASGAVQGADPAGGKIIWWCKNPGDTSSPAFGGGLVYADDGRDPSHTGVCVDPSGTGDVSATNVKWQLPVKNDLSSPIIVGEHLYRQSSRTLQCIKLADGSPVYSEPMPGYHFWASPVATADGLLYFATAGTSYVIKAGPKFEVVAKNDLGDMHFASAAVSDGKIFLRGNKFLFCIGRK